MEKISIFFILEQRIISSCKKISKKVVFPRYFDQKGIRAGSFYLWKMAKNASIGPLLYRIMFNLAFLEFLEKKIRKAERYKKKMVFEHILTEKGNKRRVLFCVKNSKKNSSHESTVFLKKSINLDFISFGNKSNESSLASDVFQKKNTKKGH